MIIGVAITLATAIGAVSRYQSSSACMVIPSTPYFIGNYGFPYSWMSLSSDGCAGTLISLYIPGLAADIVVWFVAALVVLVAAKALVRHRRFPKSSAL